MYLDCLDGFRLSLFCQNNCDILTSVSLIVCVAWSNVLPSLIIVVSSTNFTYLTELSALLRSLT